MFSYVFGRSYTFMFAFHFSFFFYASTVISLEVDFNIQDKLSDGERLYGELVKKAQSYGDCWKIAMADLRIGCRSLTEEIQSRLALSFSDCFLEHAGMEPSRCPRDTQISECLKNSDDRVFSTYTEFFTHTQSICHYLQHREWQEEASKTVLQLTENSKLVSKKLEESSKSQAKILDLQQAALYEQKRLITSGRILKAELQHSKDSARGMYEEFKTATNEQKFLLFQVFDRVKSLQNFVLGEFTGVYTVVYHTIAAALIYISTSVPRTAEARIWLILIAVFAAASERILTAHTLQESSLEVNHERVNELLYSRIWLLRKMIWSVCLVILIATYYRYKDYNVINNHLLQEIQQQNKELLSFMKGLSFHENIQNFPAPFSASNNNPLVLYDAAKGRPATNTGTKEVSESVAINIKNSTTPQQVLENKENIPLTSTPNPDAAGKLKKASKKASVRQKKNPVGSQSNTPKMSSHEGSVLSELGSPISPRYNLRRSSRLNSPYLSPPNGVSPKEAPTAHK